MKKTDNTKRDSLELLLSSPYCVDGMNTTSLNIQRIMRVTCMGHAFTLGLSLNIKRQGQELDTLHSQYHRQYCLINYIFGTTTLLYLAAKIDSLRKQHRH
uniref:Uncharacterized protein n=1 Tax=Setaria italica TaxID=4555 RepID=K3Y0A2_SETIT